MKPTALLSTLALSLALGGTPAAAAEPTASAPTVQIQQIRNATLKLEYAGRTFLVDPMLGARGAYPGFKGTYNQHLRNPLVELPIPAAEVMRGVDAVVVTHTHLDHWDGGEHAFVPKDLPIFVQHQADAEQVRGQGYRDVRVIEGSAEFEGVRLTRTGGQHGTDAMFAVEPVAGLLGQAMGVVFQAPGAATVYVVGDTTWHGEVEQALAAFKPDVVVLNTGDARVLGFTGSIIMGRDDVLRAARAAPGAAIVATHMDAINHMTLSREVLRDHVRQNGLEDRVRVPADGETMAF
ncbi:L-ascorbate metabolism protein UlaG (beta-lactamase superfamily) [Luteimonas sp. J16]|jgi:L-ascorbate metabolism protein UlaG (beta-lactamase superfamily)|uniref:MBL fold metallo-hydrolase n=1 Tax=unclassified Luteimonas TaxID=2629088 RepID=UPI000478BEE7|nr:MULTISPECIES: MBL fold metallo-hydrolase [unclassified Luteimonas]TWG85932.1 L-ascorbate metabolism protein UlaG (beta-lactamase superfamily) [Luteimonas sp. J16]